MSAYDDDIDLAIGLSTRGYAPLRELLVALQRAWTEDRRSLAAVLVSNGVVKQTDIDRVVANERAGVDAFLPSPNRRYTHEKKLGEGGMGVVMQVRDRAFGRSVAMKHLSAASGSTDEAIGGLLTEARIAGMLEHPNILPIYDVGSLPGGEPYYTMRLLDTLSLSDILGMLRDGNPEAAREYPLLRLMRIFLQVAYALDYAHGRGVIHRDVKPDNVRVGHYGEAQLCDWGLARADGLPDLPLRKALQDALARGEKNPCIVIGTPNYMSTEQAAGKNEEVGPASDVYGLGALLYELLTLAPPVQGADTLVILQKVDVGDVTPPRERAPERRIPVELETLCMTCMSPKREDRPPDVRVVCRAVEAWLDGMRDRERQAERAFRETERGQRYSDAFHRLREARRTTHAADPLAPSTRDAARELEREIAAAFFQAHDAFTRAAGFAPNDLVARAKLAELAASHLEDCEAREDELGCQMAWYLLRRNNDGAFDHLLQGQTGLSVSSDPAGAAVWLRALAHDGRMETTARAVGTTPCTLEELPAGLYQLVAEHVAHGNVTRPIFLAAGSVRSIRVLFGGP